MAHRGLISLFVAGALVSSAAAGAPRDPAAAELLFREARKALDAGRTEEACVKFAESQRLDPAAGTLINLAACEEKLGKLASAWEKWQQALRALPADDERRGPVSERAAALESKLPRLEIRLAEGAPAGTKVVRDGLELGRASLGLALPVDPGAHEIEVTAPGHEPKRIQVSLAEAENEALEVAPGPPLPEPVDAPGPASGPAPRPRAAAPPARDTAADGAGQRTLGFVVGGVGVAGIVVGSVAGVLALQKKNEVDDDCSDTGSGLECGPSGLDAAAAGNTYATVSTVAFAVGVVGLGVGGWLVLSSSDSRPSAAVGARAAPGGALIGVAGAF